MQCLAAFDLLYVILSILMFGIPSTIDGYVVFIYM